MALFVGCAPSPGPPPPTRPAPPATVSGDATTPGPIAAPISAPTPAPPDPPAVAAEPDDGRRYRAAPPELEHVVIKLGFPPSLQFDNLRYEGHNGLVASDTHDGAEVAARWRSVVAGTRGVFVLRDSLYSQQDHPYHRAPVALMLPPMWVTAAVAEVAANRPIRLPKVPAPSDDAAWGRLDRATMFGSFPPSDSLHREAVRPLAGASDDDMRHTRAARASLASLAADARAMRDAAPRGPRAVAEAGADRIAASDRAYFGRALRHYRVIPILVENPLPKEVETEGKGLVPPGPPVAPELLSLVRDALLRRRLRDGDIALERYDLSQLEQRQRAVELLRALLPADDPAPGGTVWLWVNGRLDPHRKAEGENAVRYLPKLEADLRAAGIARDRLQILSKPATEIPPGAGRPAAFRGDAKWYHKRGYPYAVRLTAGDLEAILASP